MTSLGSCLLAVMLTHRCLLQISKFTRTDPGGSPVSGFYPAAQASPGTTSPSGITGSAAVALQVVDVDVSQLSASVVAPVGAAPAVDLSKVVDRMPPVITLQGDAYTTVLQASQYSDAGVAVYDNVDGSSLAPRISLRLCARPRGGATTAAGALPVNCSAAQIAAVNTMLPSNDSAAFVLTYTAKDTAGNAAVPAYRWVVVTPR